MEITDVTVTGWIYNFSDYRQIYDLTADDLKKFIFDFPGGISSFNTEANEQGIQVVSGDAIYAESEADISQYAHDMLQVNEKHLRDTSERLKDASKETLQKVLSDWKTAEQQFLADFQSGKKAQRYQAVDFPTLPYSDHYFDLALCSNILFHKLFIAESSRMDMLGEICRIAEEVRIFPLLDEQGRMTDVLGPIMLDLQQKNYGVEVREVPFELQKGGNAMLRIWAQACPVG